MRLERLLVVTVLLSASLLFAQRPQKDQGKMVEKKNEFFEKIKKSSEEFQKEQKPKRLIFQLDLTGYDLPESPEQFEQAWYQPPISQGWTGTCWCFSTTSFYESEIYRLTGRKIKLSEMFTVYWEYVEKARRFIRERGNSAFAEGSEANAVKRMWKMYGVVPESAYDGKLEGQEFHDHHKMFAEMRNYLNSLKTSNAWNEEAGLETIKSILNHYMGKPPETVEVDGKKLTPKEYLRDVVRLNLDDYVEFMSLKEKPYYQMAEYDVPDNWWHSEDYYNVPLDDFMAVVKRAVRNGYTICLGGDVSESGYIAQNDVGIVPTFDIPSEYIDENARQYRFSNESTTDDHGIHLVGYMEKDGKDWYLIKDSSSSAQNGKHPGFYFYHEDYVKLKMMNVMVHKDMAKEVLAKFAN